MKPNLLGSSFSPKMVISSDAVVGRLPSFSETLGGLDGRLLPAYTQVQGYNCFNSELSNSNSSSSSSAKAVSSDGNCYDPMSNIEEQLMDGELNDQSLDDRPIDTRDEPSATTPVDSVETPIDSEDGEDDYQSAMEIEPMESPSRLPISPEHLRTTFYRPCICHRYGRLDLPGSWNSRCGPECEFYPRLTESWDSSGESWGYGRDDRPLRFLLPAETGVGAGLYNLGNTCFLNAILQCFTHTVPLVKALRSSNHLMHCQRGFEGFCVACALRNHIERSLSSSGKIISPSQVVDNLNKISSCFHRYQQEDAHEFLQCLLDKLERCCLDSSLKEGTLSSQDDNIVQRVFGGRLVSKLRCCSCGHCSDKYEPLIDLSLEIEDAETLQDALDSFTKVERIEDSETKLKCDYCKEEVSMEKQLILDQPPSVVALHLKRFKIDGSSIEKIGKPVDFSLQLDLEPYSHCSNDAQEILKYQLYGVVVHDGFSPTSGHYFCYIRSSPSIWHKLDDSMVVKVEEEMVLSESAYILFYVREDAPWFSSLMETLKDPNTSPKSVLEGMESAYAYVESSDICKAIVDEDDIESTPLPCVPMGEDDKMNRNGINADEITTQICSASKNPDDKPCCDKSRDDVPDLLIAVEVKDCHDKLSALPGEEIKNEQVVQRNDAPMPLSPPNFQLYFKRKPELRHKVGGDHIKMENAINEKKQKKGNRDENARKEAVRYVQKNVAASRRMKLLAAMAPQNKKRKSSWSPCKQSSSNSRRHQALR